MARLFPTAELISQGYSDAIAQRSSWPTSRSMRPKLAAISGGHPIMKLFPAWVVMLNRFDGDNRGFWVARINHNTTSRCLPEIRGSVVSIGKTQGWSWPGTSDSEFKGVCPHPILWAILLGIWPSALLDNVVTDSAQPEEIVGYWKRLTHRRARINHTYSFVT